VFCRPRFFEIEIQDGAEDPAVIPSPKSIMGISSPKIATHIFLLQIFLPPFAIKVAGCDLDSVGF
jgi:hypothetical protein